MSSGNQPYGDASTREAILRATWDLVEEHGARVRLVDVAERAGVSRQAVYLHFGDRSGLFRALVGHMDVALGVPDLEERVHRAASGLEALERAVELYAVIAPRIDRVARVLEAAQHDDAALAEAWRDRMTLRRVASRAIVERLAADGRLAHGWTIEAAADLFYAITLPGVWRELTTVLGWMSDVYRERMTRFLSRALTSSPERARDPRITRA